VNALKPLFIAAALACLISPAWAEDVTIHLKWYHKFQFAGYYAAIQQGYFREEGYQVKLVEGGPHSNHLHHLINNSSQYAVLGSEALSSIAVGSPIVILASIFQHAPEVLITLKSNQVKNITDLKGKALMLADASISGQIEAMLSKNGLLPGSYQKHNYNGNIEKLADGSIFAMYGYISNEPYQLHQLGLEVDIFSPQDYGIDFYGDNLATTQTELEKNPKRVAAIRKAVIRGWNYAIEHPESIIDYILSLKSKNPLPYNRDHQRYEAQETIKLIDTNNFPIGHSSPVRWVAMLDTFNEVTEGQAVLSEHSIYNEFHRDTTWIRNLLLASLIGVIIIFALYYWNRTLRIRLDQAVVNLNEVAFEDSLTGMQNRSAMVLHIERCRENHKENMYIAIIDILGLQKINRLKGFKSADNMINNVATTITSSMFKNSKSYSLYGGKFAIIAHAQRQEEFTQKINTLMAHISNLNEDIKLNSGAIKLDFSLDNSSLTTRAEMALQHSKNLKSPYLTFFSKSFSDEIEAQEKILKEVQEGINKQEFIAYYQPKVHYVTGKILGVEALVRWDHPTKGILLPGKFLPIVERSPELMLRLENTIIEKVLSEANQLINYFKSNTGFRISINLSSLEFNQKSLVSHLVFMCERFEVDPKFIEFELTESSMLEDLESAIHISNQLQNAGFHVALDDFGTGYSSLAYIQNLPINVIKLDYSFVRKIPADIRSSYVVEHIISLAHKLGLIIVAEGVEQKEQLDYLGGLNVDFIQGFYFHKPISMTELLTLPFSESNFHP
jgi:diguanylate cyclase (GGDEF)-like protein